MDNEAEVAVLLSELQPILTRLDQLALHQAGAHVSVAVHCLIAETPVRPFLQPQTGSRGRG